MRKWRLKFWKGFPTNATAWWQSLITRWHNVGDVFRMDWFIKNCRNLFKVWEDGNLKSTICADKNTETTTLSNALLTTTTLAITPAATTITALEMTTATTTPATTMTIETTTATTTATAIVTSTTSTTTTTTPGPDPAVLVLGHHPLLLNLVTSMTHTVWASCLYKTAHKNFLQRSITKIWVL